MGRLTVAMAMLQKSRDVRGLKVFTYDHQIRPDLGHFRCCPGCGSLICGSAMHAAAYRSIVVALRGARPVTPKRIRRGGNTGSFDLVARTERQLVASGRATLSNA